MKNTLSELWRPVIGVFIRAVSPNLFIFQYFHELDMDRVVKGGPWTFDRNLLLMKKLDAEEDPT